MSGFLMPPRPLTKFEIQKYYQNKPAVKQTQRRFDGIYSRKNLPKIKDGGICNKD